MPYRDPISLIVAGAVLASWFFFAGVFLFRKKAPQRKEVRRDRVSILGMALQAVGFSLVWSIRRFLFAPIVHMPKAAEIALGILTIAIAYGSVLLCMSAVKTLGEQWAFAARLVEGHKLITAGPYRWVRNPIYSGMFGMMLATGLAFSRWIALPPAILLFAIGTFIRVRSEEKLLQSAFGQEFTEYKNRVSAVLPGIW